VVGPVPQRELPLGRRAGRGDHARAHRLAQLHGGQAHAAGRAQHQQRFARLHARALLERIERSAVHHRHRRGLREAHRGGQGEGALLRQHDLLREAAAVGARDAHHAVAHLVVRDAGGHLEHHAARFAARNPGQRRLDLVLALGLQRVGKVHARGPHGDAHLARAQRTRLYLFEAQAIDRRERVANDGFHGFLFFWRPRPVGHRPMDTI
jgi:hypothetical protein